MLNLNNLEKSRVTG